VATTAVTVGGELSSAGNVGCWLFLAEVLVARTKSPPPSIALRNGGLVGLTGRGVGLIVVDPLGVFDGDLVNGSEVGFGVFLLDGEDDSGRAIDRYMPFPSESFVIDLKKLVLNSDVSVVAVPNTDKSPTAFTKLMSTIPPETNL